MVSWAASTEAEADTYELMLRQREADNRQHEKRDAEETPHFTDSLTTSINWVNSRICGPQKRRFLVKYTVQRCAQSGRELNVWREEVVLTSPGQGSENITILPPQSRNTRFDALAPWREYAVEVQPITNRGVGVAVSSIIAPTDLSADTSEAVEERALNDLEFIELPLESAAPTSLRILLPLLAVFLLR
ncbi:unnamed protein product, partial [Mesorhabditis spiculigera]